MLQYLFLVVFHAPKDQNLESDRMRVGACAGETVCCSTRNCSNDVRTTSDHLCKTTGALVTQMQHGILWRSGPTHSGLCVRGFQVRGMQWACLSYSCRSESQKNRAHWTISPCTQQKCLNNLGHEPGNARIGADRSSAGSGTASLQVQAAENVLLAQNNKNQVLGFENLFFSLFWEPLLVS